MFKQFSLCDLAIKKVKVNPKSLFVSTGVPNAKCHVSRPLVLEKIFKGFPIYGQGSHLDQVIKLMGKNLIPVFP